MRPLIAYPTFVQATLVACVCAAASSVEAANTLSKIRETRTITIAHCEASPPIYCLDGNKRPVGDAHFAEPYAIMLRKDDTPFKTVVDHEMGKLIYEGDSYELYDKRFKGSIPSKGINMNMLMGRLLRDFLHYPMNKAGDGYVEPRIGFRAG